MQSKGPNDLLVWNNLLYVLWNLEEVQSACTPCAKATKRIPRVNHIDFDGGGLWWVAAGDPKNLDPVLQVFKSLVPDVSF